MIGGRACPLFQTRYRQNETHFGPLNVPVICSEDVVYEARGWMLPIDPLSVEVVLSFFGEI